ncbi:MAG: zf-HC2 domain-containing protein [Gemmatimonadota bacterium]|nr:zf-HC2 domain-containing protein [Gemmatimonadota bacterium]
MHASRSDHPDEGTIHAWLDGAFDAPTAAAIEAHVASCPSCTERVAEARGLIAGASRVVSALDDVPSGVTPAWGRAPSTPGANAPRTGGAGRRFRVTPARAAIAATILIALGVTLTRQRTAPEAELKKSNVAAASSEAAAPVLPHDQLLDSAVKRNVDAASPPRTVAAAPGPNVSAPATANQSPTALQDPTAGARVGLAQGAIRAKVDSAPVAADRVATVPRSPAAGAAPASETERRETAASKKAEALSGRAPVRMDVPAPTMSLAECYRVESANGTQASWGTVTLPFVVAIDSAGRPARVIAADGSSSDRASWTRTGDDSLTFQLRRVGFTGTLTLGAAGDVRAGVMRSAPAPLLLSESVIAGGVTAQDSQKRVTTRRRAAQKAISPRAPAAVTLPENGGAPAIAVVARRVACSPAP